jgi:hypothetical protein
LKRRRRRRRCCRYAGLTRLINPLYCVACGAWRGPNPRETQSPTPSSSRSRSRAPKGLVSQVVEVLEEHFISACGLPRRNDRDREVHVYVVIKAPR